MIFVACIPFTLLKFFLRGEESYPASAFGLSACKKTPSEKKILWTEPHLAKFNHPSHHGASRILKLAGKWKINVSETEKG